MTIQEIEKAVLKHYPGVTSQDLKTDSREQKFVQPRLAIWYIARYTYSIKVTELADYYKRKHSTVCRMIFKTDNCLDLNKVFKMKLNKINSELLDPEIC